MDSKLILASNIKLDKSYTNVLSYNTTQMLSLVESNKEYEQWNYNNIDYDKGVIQVSTDYSVAIGCNYLAFQNPRHGNKWYFAFIDDVIYKSPNCCDVKFTIDVWSTFYDNWTAKPCFVVREHVNNDTIGLHTVDENLACENYIKIGTQTDFEYLDTSYIAICCSYDPASGKDFQGVMKINNNIFGYQIYLVANNDNGLENLEKFIMKVNSVGKIDAIQNMYMIPHALIRNITLTAVLFEIPAAVGQQPIYGTVYKLGTFSSSAKRFKTEVNDVSGYTVKNNKCKCYPYRYLEVTNNNGNSNVFKIEFFNKNDNNKMEFWNELAFSPGVSGRVVPYGYKNDEMLYDDPDYNNLVEIGKYPNCGWSGDAYINWLTQNAVNIPTSFINFGNGTASTVQNTGNSIMQGTATKLDVAGAGLDIASNAANIIGQFYSASLLPNISHGGNCGDVSFATNTTRIDYNTYRLCDEDMKQIDDYFTRFGYKINETKTPNITGRAYWNFIEIGQDESIGFGTVPSKYMEIINNACRQGVTIWHDHSNIGNFNLTNSIV